jgi:cation diffusion facilitator family transporter
VSKDGDRVKKSAGRRVVNAAIFANGGIAVAKFIVAGISGSSAMLSEGIHSTVDTFNECLLLLGIRRSRMAPDELHPFGLGKELFFWGLIVAVLLFGLGAGMAIYEGITHLLKPRATTNLLWTYVVLGIAAAFEGYSFYVAYRTLGAHHDAGSPSNWWRRVRRSKDPSVFSVFVEDLAALTGIAFALLGVTLGALLHNPYFDGVASLLIGATLATAAAVLAHETRKLLVGESAPPDVVRSIREVAEREGAVIRSDTPLTMQLSPSQFFVTVDLHMRDGLTGDEQLESLERIEHGIREQHPGATKVSLYPKRST